MSQMFSGASVFNQNISDWDINSVINTTDMFQNATAMENNYYVELFTDASTTKLKWKYVFDMVRFNQVFLDNYQSWYDGNNHLHLREIQIWVNNENIASYDGNGGINNGSNTLDGVDYRADVRGSYMIRNPYDEQNYPSGNINDNKIDGTLAHTESNRTEYLGVQLNKTVKFDDIQAIVIYNREGDIGKRILSAFINITLDYSYPGLDSNSLPSNSMLFVLSFSPMASDFKAKLSFSFSKSL